MKTKSNVLVRKSVLPFIVNSVLLIVALAISGFGFAPNIDMNMVTSAGISDVTPQEIPTDQIIIKYKSDMKVPNFGTQVIQMERLSDSAGIMLEYVREMSDEEHVLRLPERLPLKQVQAIADHLMALPEVEYAEPDYILYHTLIPSDPQYSNQWQYHEIWGIDLPAAWDITTGSSSVVVAVVDTGITDHADLRGRTVPGYDFISTALDANDGDGRDNDPSDPGDWITFAESSSGYFAGCPVENSSWHGTHTAGTIGATSNNGLGVTGVNWKSKILPVRVLGKCGGYTSDIVDGVRWAAGLAVTGVPANTNPAKVINLSLGGLGSCDSTWQSAVNAVTTVGTVVVVAAGNSNTDANFYVPANCNGVITVAATNRNGSRAYYSNYGSSVEISAPGGETRYANDPNGILSTINTGTTVPVSDSYAYYQGTSMAAPHVSGVVSLLFSINPVISPSAVLGILQSTAKAFPGGSTCNTSICGSGIVDAGSAVAYLIQPPGSFAKKVPADGIAGQPTSPTLAWGASSGATSYEYCYDTTNDNACSSWVSTGTATSVNPSGLSFGTTYYWQVRAIGNSLITYADNGTWRSFTTLLFADVSEDYWAYDWINRLYKAGITGGCIIAPPSFCPDAIVTRAQMAVFLERSIHFPTTFTPLNASPTFTDTVGHWAEDWIEVLRSDGITGGCGTNLFCPEDPVTRAQMAVFLLKSKYGSSYTPPAVGTSTGFNDVPTTHWAAAWIKQLAAEGITGGCSGGNYCPDNPVTRAEMAVFLVKMFQLP